MARAARRALLGTARLRRRFLAIASRHGVYNMHHAAGRLLHNMMLGRQRATMVDPGGARQLVYASMAVDAGAQTARRRERCARASGIKVLLHCAYWLKLFEVVCSRGVIYAGRATEGGG